MKDALYNFAKLLNDANWARYYARTGLTEKEVMDMQNKRILDQNNKIYHSYNSFKSEYFKK